MEQHQAMRFNTGKPKMSFLLDFPNAMKSFVRVLEFGAKKYARNNWKKGRDLSDTRDSQLRHAFAFHNGQDIDDESECEHLAHEMVNIAFMIEFKKTYGDIHDDRDKAFAAFVQDKLKSMEKANG